MSKNNGNLANEGKVHKKKRKQVNVYDMLFNSRRKRKTRFSIENVGLAKTNSMQHSNNNSDSSSFKHIHNNNNNNSNNNGASNKIFKRNSNDISHHKENMENQLQVVLYNSNNNQTSTENIISSKSNNNINTLTIYQQEQARQQALSFRPASSLLYIQKATRKRMKIPSALGLNTFTYRECFGRFIAKAARIRLLNSVVKTYRRSWPNFSLKRRVKQGLEYKGPWRDHFSHEIFALRYTRTGTHFAAAGLVRSNTSTMGYIRLYNHNKFLEIYKNKNALLNGNENIQNKHIIMNDFKNNSGNDVPPYHCIATRCPINDVQFCPWNENIFATSHRASSQILLYDMKKWEDRPFIELTVGRNEKKSQGNNAVCFIPSTKQIVSAGAPIGCLRVWDLRTSRSKGININTIPRYRLGGRPDFKFFRSTSQATALCASFDGRTVFAGNSSGDIIGWDLRNVKTPSFGVRAEPHVSSYTNVKQSAMFDSRDAVSKSRVDPYIKSIVMDRQGTMVFQTSKGYVGTLNVNELNLHNGRKTKYASLYQLSEVGEVSRIERQRREATEKYLQQMELIANGGVEIAPSSGTSYRVASVVSSSSSSSSTTTTTTTTSSSSSSLQNSNVNNNNNGSQSSTNIAPPKPPPKQLPKQGHVLSFYPTMDSMVCTGLTASATMVYMDVSERSNMNGKIRQWRRQLLPNNNRKPHGANQSNVTALACHPHGDLIIAALGGGSGELIPINNRFGLAHHF